MHGAQYSDTAALNKTTSSQTSPTPTHSSGSVILEDSPPTAPAIGAQDNTEDMKQQHLESSAEKEKEREIEKRVRAEDYIVTPFHLSLTLMINKGPGAGTPHLPKFHFDLELRWYVSGATFNRAQRVRRVMYPSFTSIPYIYIYQSLSLCNHALYACISIYLYFYLHRFAMRLTERQYTDLVCVLDNLSSIKLRLETATTLAKLDPFPSRPSTISEGSENETEGSEENWARQYWRHAIHSVLKLKRSGSNRLRWTDVKRSHSNNPDNPDSSGLITLPYRC